MSVLKKVFLVTIIIVCISFGSCYAIDENQLTSNTNLTTTQSDNRTMPEELTPQIENSIDTNPSIDLTEETTSSLESSSFSDSDSQASTTVSSVSSVSKTSTITNILNIALLVVGVLLIFLAIAILIRLNS